MNPDATLLRRFVEYAQAFEKTYVDDDWTRLEPYFAPDAAYRVVGSTSWDCEVRGHAQVLAAIRKFVNEFDRKCTRTVRPAGAPLVGADTVMANKKLGDVDGGPRMRLPNTAHTSRPWRIHEFTGDFRLEDVWALPTPGGPNDFPRLVQLVASLDPSQSSSGAVRTLFAIRWKLGELLGWDGPDAGLGSRVPTLRDRLPMDLRDAPSGPDFDALPFTPLYLLDDEWAAEIANRTMHGVMHLGWVPDGTGGYRGQMAVYVKPNGLLGTAYMAAIRPFRHLIVYPPAMREFGRNWWAGTRSPSWVGAPT